MTSKCFFTSAWTIGGDVEWNGPYPDKDTAQSILGENILGNTDMSGAVIGPPPFEQVITDGKWGDGSTDLDKSIARQWAVFEVLSGDLAWVTFGDEDNLKEDFNFHWVGNYEGTDPAAVFKEMADNDRVTAREGYEFVAVPVGVFGPTNWMRVAGDMLTKIKN